MNDNNLASRTEPIIDEETTRKCVESGCDTLMFTAAGETAIWRVIHDGASRPIIEIKAEFDEDSRWLSLNQFQDGRWSSYKQEDADATLIVNAVNLYLEGK